MRRERPCTAIVEKREVIIRVRRRRRRRSTETGFAAFAIGKERIRKKRSFERIIMGMGIDRKEEREREGKRVVCFFGFLWCNINSCVGKEIKC